MAADWRHVERRGYCRRHTVHCGAADRLGPLEARWFGYAPAGSSAAQCSPPAYPDLPLQFAHDGLTLTVRVAAG